MQSIEQIFNHSLDPGFEFSPSILTDQHIHLCGPAFEHVPLRSLHQLIASSPLSSRSERARAPCAKSEPFEPVFSGKQHPPNAVTGHRSVRRRIGKPVSGSVQRVTIQLGRERNATDSRSRRMRDSWESSECRELRAGDPGDAHVAPEPSAAEGHRGGTR